MKITCYCGWIILLCFFCGISCNKEIIIRHRIVNAITKKGIHNVKVELYRLTDQGLWAFTEQTFLESTHTDELGSFDFIYDTDSKKEKYRIQLQADTYFSEQVFDYPRAHEFEMDPEGYIKLRLNKTRDTLSYAHLYVSYVPEATFYGNVLDTTIIIVAKGNTRRPLNWSINRNQDYESFVKYLIIPPHDTIDYEIVF